MENTKQYQTKTDQKDKDNYEKEIQKLKDKIIELQTLIIGIGSSKEESVRCYLKLSDECLKKNTEISNLKYEVLEIKAVMASQWNIPLEKAEERLKNLQKELLLI